MGEAPAKLDVAAPRIPCNRGLGLSVLQLTISSGEPFGRGHSE